MKIVIDKQIAFAEDFFGPYGELVLLSGRAISAADLKDADMLIVRSVTPVDKKLLADSAVKFVGSVTAGADHLDTQWLQEAGISYSVAAGFNAPPVADYVVSVIAALQKKQYLPAEEFKVAIIGVGNVGRQVAQRLQALNCQMIFADPIRALAEKDFVSTQLDEIADMDLILVHVPLTQGEDHPTYHFINKAFLRRQKPGCVLLNASRGAVIHSADLIKSGQHLYWCMDVWEHEPKINKTILETAITATPHIAGYSVQGKIRGIDMIYRIACEKKIILPQPFIPHPMPKQRLNFSGPGHRWQDVVLGVFNPLLITQMMRTLLLPAEDYGPLFDEMRNQFNYRYEFAYTQITDTEILEEDKKVLEGLGFTIHS